MPEPEKQSYWSLFIRFLKFGFLAWGGPVAQIAMLRKELVDEEKWISSEQFNRVLAVYQVLPGPEATEMCLYFGMRSKGRIGGLLAGIAFLLPGFIFMLLLTWFYVAVGLKSLTVAAIFAGIHAAVIALIVSAVHRLGRHAATNRSLLVIVIVSTILHYFLPFYIILPLGGIVYHFIRSRKIVSALLIASATLLVSVSFFYKGISIDKEIVKEQDEDRSMEQIFKTGFKAGALTFGGAYTAIPFVKEDAVEKYKWMTEDQFLDGIALSGLLPAPLIIFTTFTGYFGGGWIGTLLITFAVFLPAFLITLLAHNTLEKVIQITWLHDFLDGVTASVIGLIALTAITLFLSTITSVLSVVIFLMSIAVLYLSKLKLATLYVICWAGLLSYLVSII